MNILYFSRDYTTHDHRFLRELAQSPHQVCFLRLEDDGIPYESRPVPEKVQVVDWPGGRHPYKSVEAWLGLMPAFEMVLKELQPDLVHAGPVQSCGFMTALVGFHPFVLMSWGSDVLVDADRSDSWRWITRHVLERCDAFVCDSDSVRKKVKLLTPYPEERIVQFPWGIDLRRFRSRKRLNLRGKLGWPEDSIVILSTRSWEPIYGIDILLESFKQAYVRNSKLRLVLLGTGSLSPEVQQFIKTHQLDKVISQPGVIPNERIPDYFLAADLYMSCAYSDGTSISLLEAMAAGLPVIVTDAPGNREWVVTGRHGWLVPPGDSAGFAERLLLGAGLPEADYHQIAQESKRVVEERANWDHNFITLLRTYDQLTIRN